MSCWKCGFRFLWRLEEGANRCPKCNAIRKWNQDPEYKRPAEVPTNLSSAVELKKSYMREKYHASRVKRDHPLGEPRIYKQSTSFQELIVDEVTSSGWRPYSKLETYVVSSPCQKEYFDRTYSRAYSRPYSNPYNLPEEPNKYSYPTGYCGTRKTTHFNVTGSGREPLLREGRDYKARVQPSFQVKSYDRTVIRIQEEPLDA